MCNIDTLEEYLDKLKKCEKQKPFYGENCIDPLKYPSYPLSPSYGSNKAENYAKYK